jgi:hypothetical protein
MMLKALSFLQKNLVWSIPFSMIVGLLTNDLFDAGPPRLLIIPVTLVEEPQANGALSALS